jgi:hypothetical protein
VLPSGGTPGLRDSLAAQFFVAAYWKRSLNPQMQYDILRIEVSSQMEGRAQEMLKKAYWLLYEYRYVADEAGVGEADNPPVQMFLREVEREFPTLTASTD